jgi:hypothetical protein
MTMDRSIQNTLATVEKIAMSKYRKIEQGTHQLAG